MKIAYLIHWNEGSESGVLKKVMHQLTEWRRQGHEPALFLFTCNPNEDWEGLCAEQGIPLVVQIYRGTSGRMADFGLLSKQVRRWCPDVIYHRFDLYYLSLPGLLRSFPSVLEINTNDMAELRMEQGFRYYYHALTRGKVLSAASGHVYVSRELAESEHFRSYAKPSIVIGNGIRLAEYPLGEKEAATTNAPVPVEKEKTMEVAETMETTESVETLGIFGPLTLSDSRPPRLVFIGSAGQSWHGLDHIAELAALKPDWRFDLIGVEAAELVQALNAVDPVIHAASASAPAGAGSGLSKGSSAAAVSAAVLTAERTQTAGDAEPLGGMPPNLFFHGKMTRSSYQYLLDEADIAIGTLALYRKDMKEASPLKVREYLANGLPVIIGYEETDFPEEVPFLLKLPAVRDNIRPHLDQIVEFVEFWQGLRIPSEQVARLDTSRKEAERLGFMEQIATKEFGKRK